MVDLRVTVQEKTPDKVCLDFHQFWGGRGALVKPRRRSRGIFPPQAKEAGFRRRQDPSPRAEELREERGEAVLCQVDFHAIVPSHCVVAGAANATRVVTVVYGGQEGEKNSRRGVPTRCYGAGKFDKRASQRRERQEKEAGRMGGPKWGGRERLVVHGSGWWVGWAEPWMRDALLVTSSLRGNGNIESWDGCCNRTNPRCLRLLLLTGGPPSAACDCSP